MKKIFYVLLLILIGIGFIVVSYNQNKKDIKVALVCDVGNIDDKSFNQNAWEGILRYAKDNNLSKKNYMFATSPAKEDYVVNLSTFSDRKDIDLIIATGYFFEQPISIVASRYPNQNFLLIDAISKTDKNILSVTFNMNEGSFLVGVAAALKANSMSLDKIGFLGGVDGYIVQSFEAGFLEGIKTINPNIKVFIEYANDFANPTKGQQIASKMYDDGINIIFNVAGYTGTGLIKEAKRRAKKGEDVWVIGVDKDQYEEGIYAAGKSVILTSMLKKIDSIIYNSIDLVKQGEFKGGSKVYGLKDRFIGLPQNNPNLKEEWLKIIKTYKDDIVSGKIIVPNKPFRAKK